MTHSHKWFRIINNWISALDLFCLCLWVYFVVISQVDYSKHWPHRNRIGSRLHYNLHFYIRELYLDWASFWIFSFGERNLPVLFHLQQWSVFCYSGLEFQESSWKYHPTHFFSPKLSLYCCFTVIKTRWKVPLVFLGYYHGQKKPAYENPVRTNQIHRQIPEQQWFMNSMTSMLMAGILPFGAVFIELFFIFTGNISKPASDWRNDFFTRSEYNNSLMRWVININQF